MEKIQALKNAIEFAKQNPDDPQSFELRKRIESGVYNNELNQIKLQAKVEQHKSEMPQEETGLAGFATGVGKGILSTVKGVVVFQQTGQAEPHLRMIISMLYSRHRK